MIPSRFAPQVYSIFRVVFGFLFLFHGLQKMFGMFGGRASWAPPASENGGEPAVLFCFAFLYIAAKGVVPGASTHCFGGRSKQKASARYQDVHHLPVAGHQL